MSAICVPRRTSATYSTSGSGPWLTPWLTPGSLGPVRGANRGEGSAGSLPFELGLHENVEVAIEDGTGVRCLDVRPEVLDHLVGVQDVTSNLVAPARRDVLA